MALALSAMGLLFFVSMIVAAPAGDPSLAVVPEEAAGVEKAPEIGSADGTVAIAPESAGTELGMVTSLAGGQSAVVRFDDDTGAPAFVSGDINVEAAGGPEESAYAFLSDNSGLFKLDDPESELAVNRLDEDQLGMAHVHMDQLYQGVPVFGSGFAVHISSDGRIKAANGRLVPGLNLSVEPDISPDEAVSAARAAMGADVPSEPSADPELVILAPADGDASLAWKVILVSDEPPARMVYFVDAHTSRIAGSYDDLQDARNRLTYTANYGTSLPGTLLISEGGSSSDSVAQNAHVNTGSTYDYYFNTFGRDSYNGSGATLKSTVHYSSNYNNAFWNGSQMTYGDGDGHVFSPLGNSLDVVAHELTHGVTQYSAGLIYSYQSGALNESYSDVFGAMVDRDDWLLGEDVYTPQTPGDALRSLSNPAQFGQPAHMDNYVNTSSDNGGVHTNSGIPNKAAYNVAMAIGKEKMEQIWYRTLTLYLTSSSQFTDARDASVQAATDLYGSGSAEVTAVSNGFSAVGIGGTQLSDTTARIEIDHTYRGDLVVTLGVGDPNSPAWSTVVSNRSGGSADDIYQTVDIAAAVSYLPPDWQNRWFLKVYDAAGYDTGTITKFTITDHDTTYTATDVPLAVNDYQTTISYVPTSDATPPTVSSFDPQPGETGVYAHANVAVGFSEGMLSSTICDTSFTLKKAAGGIAVPAAITYDSNARTATLDPDADLEYSTVYEAELTTDITDLAGNPLQQSYKWSFTTAPEPKRYYFTWYDMNSSPSMRDWVVMGNPESRTSDAGFDVFINSARASSEPVMVQPGSTKAVTYPGTMGGPVSVAALDGYSQIVSKRTLYGDSLEEINGFEESRLDSHYYFTWYDTVSPGSRDWILISNPGSTAIEADVYIAGVKKNSEPYLIEPGATVTPEYKSVIGGPVEVLSYEPGNPSVPQNSIVSQRVLWKGDFNEVMGIPATELTNDYLFTWYDMRSSGARSWVLVSNPHTDTDLAVEIWIGDSRMTDSASGNQYFTVPAGESIVPTFPQKMDGPVEVKGYDAATYDPANPGSPNLDFYTTQRSLFGNTFEEVLGYGVNGLSASYFYSWYDQKSWGSQDWVLVANPGTAQVKAEVWIGGTRRSILTIDPGSTVTPTYQGVMSGPVEVRGYQASTYDPDNPGTPDAMVFSSQRVMWKGHFNEVTGAVVD